MDEGVCVEVDAGVSIRVEEQCSQLTLWKAATERTPSSTYMGCVRRPLRVASSLERGKDTREQWVGESAWLGIGVGVNSAGVRILTWKKT